MRTPRQARLDLCALVGGAAVHNDVDVEPVRDIEVDHLEEVEELPGPVAAIALADDRGGGDVRRREQRDRAVALVIVGTPLGDAGQHRQDRLGAVEGLELALFVDAQHQRAIRRREVETDDVTELDLKVRISRQLVARTARRDLLLKQLRPATVALNELRHKRTLVLQHNLKDHHRASLADAR